MTEFGEPLTDREQDVLVCLVQGSSNKEIAQQLTISPNTVKVHVRNIYTKLGVSSRTEATTAALQQGLLAIPGIEVTTGQTVEEPEEVPLVDPVPAEGAAPGIVTANAAITPPASDLPVTPASKPLTRHWPRMVGAIVLVGIVLVALFYVLSTTDILGNSPPAEPEAESTREPFVETPIADSNWAIGRPMSLARANAAAAVVGLDLYQIGGETEDGVVNLVEIFALDDKEWLPGAPKLTAVASAAAAVLAGEIYVIGGRLPNGQATAAVEAYSPLNDGWRPATPLPQPTYGGWAASDGNSIYYFGGVTEDGVTAQSYRYDPTSQAWAPLPAMAQPRAHSTGGLLNGQFMLVGGVGADDRSLATCEIFDPLTESWSSCLKMQQSRAGAGAAVVLNKLYVVGGQSGAAPRFGESFDPNTGVWTSFEAPMLAEQPNWAEMTMTNVETRIYVFGGSDGERLLTDGFVLTPFAYQFFIPAASSGGEPEK